MKKKIYFFNPYPGIGGADTLIHRFINSINLKKYDVEYLTLKKKNVFFSNKIKCTQINSKSTLLSFFKILKIIKNDKNKNKIFFSMQYFCNVWSIIFIKLFCNIKTFTYEINHLNELKNYQNIVEKFKKNVILFLVKRLYKYSDIVATNSVECSKDLSSFINRKVRTIYNPCFEKLNLKKNKYKKETKIRILNIARLSYQKDQLTILKAINSSKIKNYIKLTLVGFGPLKKKLSNFAKINKINVKIITNKKKLNTYYKNNDLFLYPSLYEGLPTTVVEAASFCLPIVTSNFKSGSKEILCSGRGGYTFNIKDYKRLSNIIYEFYLNPKSFYKKEKFCRKNLYRFSKYINLKKFNSVLNRI